MNRFRNYLLTFGFVIIIFSFAIGTFANSDAQYSDMEKRELDVFPAFTWENVLSGQSFDEFDDFLSDHIFLREDMIRFFCDYNVNLLHKTNVQQVSIGKDHELFETLPHNSSYFKLKEVIESENTLLKNIKKIDSKCKENNAKFYFAYAPRKSHILYNEYPAHYYSSKSEIQKLEDKIAAFCGSDIGFVNFRQSLESNAKAYYFNSDHHWNMRGALVAYQTLINEIRKDIPEVDEPYAQEDFHFKKYNNFIGIENRFLYHVTKSHDILELPIPKNGWVPYKKYEKGIRNDEIYDMDQLKAADNFDVFMNGNQSSIVFDTARPEKKDLLLVGDSYTNCIEPYLFQNFNKTRILDLRSYRKMSLEKYIDTYKPDVVVWLMNSLGVTQGGPNIDLCNTR